MLGGLGLRNELQTRAVFYNVNQPRTQGFSAYCVARSPGTINLARNTQILGISNCYKLLYLFHIVIKRKESQHMFCLYCDVNVCLTRLVKINARFSVKHIPGKFLLLKVNLEIINDV